MIGYIFDAQTRVITTKVKDVTKRNETTITNGSAKAVVGTGQYIITDQEFNEGEILPEELTDRRAEITVLAE